MSNINDDPRNRFQYDGARIAADAIKRREAKPKHVTVTEPDYYPTYDLLRFAVSDPRFGMEPGYTAKVWEKMERSKGHLTKPKTNGPATVEVRRPNLDTLPEDHVFQTTAELFAAKTDPRYERDEKYTVWVWRCEERSRVRLWPSDMR